MLWWKKDHPVAAVDWLEGCTTFSSSCRGRRNSSRKQCAGAPGSVGPGGAPSYPCWQRGVSPLVPLSFPSCTWERTRKLFRCLNESHGACLLRQPQLASLVRDALLFFENQRYELGDFVIMPNHAHLLIAPRAEWELESVLQSLKRYCAREINAALGRKGTSLWQRGFYDHIVRDETELLRCRQYIRLNPEKARLRSGEFLLRSADL